MSFKKISLDEWNRLSKQEQEHLRLMFDLSVEQRKRLTVTITRGIFLGLVLALLINAIIYFSFASELQEEVQQKGYEGFCSLCGKYALRKCECSYYQTHTAGNFETAPIDIEGIANDLAEYNTRRCLPFEQYVDNQVKDWIGENNENP